MCCPERVKTHVVHVGQDDPHACGARRPPSMWGKTILMHAMAYVTRTFSWCLKCITRPQHVCAILLILIRTLHSSSYARPYAMTMIEY